MPVQYSRLAGTAWTLWPAILYDPPVPTLELTDDELRDAAQAARIAAAQAQKDAAAQPNPRISAAFSESAESYGQLAEKCEAARRSQPRSLTPSRATDQLE
jgi:hypothetical protein